MKRNLLALVLLAISSVCLATTPPPFAGQIGALDRILAAATSTETSEAALKLLEFVATGATGEIPDGLESKVGLAQNQLKVEWFSEPTVRAHALWNIGRMDTPEALGFLKGLTPNDFRTDSSGGLWIDAQVALANATFLRISNTQSQTEFLVHTMKTSAAASWAEEELCERGALSALPDVRQFMRSRRNGRRDEEDIEFCEARIQIVSRESVEFNPGTGYGALLRNYLNSNGDGPTATITTVKEKYDFAH